MNRNIEQTYDIKAKPAEVWRALTDPNEIREWSGADASFVAKEGVAYSLWNGDITGKVVKAAAPALLSQTWQPKHWTRTDSVVTFMLGASIDGTKVVLLHENVEEADYDDTNEGWDIYYLGAIKKVLEARTRARSLGAAPTKAARRKVGTRKGARGMKAAKGMRKSAKKIRSKQTVARKIKR